jgi:peptidoglycan/xylan/chitin deacetylase (PgdA/CDA1 family)
MLTAAEIQRRRAAANRRLRRRRIAGLAATGALAALIGVLAASASKPSAGRRAPTAGRAGAAGLRTRVAAAATTSPPAPQAGAVTMPGAHRAPHEAVPILMYHVIGYAPPGTRLPSLWVTPPEFRAEVRALRDAGFHGVTLREVWNAWHHAAKLPHKPVVFSFDDGYEGQVRDALPALRRVGWPGVLNLVLKNLPDIGGTPGARRLVAAGWEIDSHTLTHPDLTTLPDADLRHELRQSRARITRLLGQPASFFCYPSGRYDARVVNAVRDAGYLAATTVALGYARPTADPFALPRVRVDGGMGAAQLRQRLRQLRGA